MSKKDEISFTLDVWKIASVFLTILLVISIVSNMREEHKIQENNVLTKDEAVNRATSFIQNYILQGAAQVSIKGDIKEEYGLYKFKMNIGGREFESYVTKDGKLLFPQAIDLTQKPQIQEGTQQSQDIPKTDKPTVMLFTMSYCPYGNQAENAMYSVAKLFEEILDIEPHLVIYPASMYSGREKDYCIDNYCSMHGIAELKEDVREICIWKYFKEKYWDYIKQVNADCNLGNIETCWSNVASKNGIDVNKIEICLENESIDILKSEYELNVKYNVRGSPTLLINEVVYRGPRTPESYKQAICSAYKDPPTVCEESLTGEVETTRISGSCG